MRGATQEHARGTLEDDSDFPRGALLGWEGGRDKILYIQLPQLETAQAQKPISTCGTNSKPEYLLTTSLNFSHVRVQTSPPYGHLKLNILWINECVSMFGLNNCGKILVLSGEDCVTRIFFFSFSYKFKQLSFSLIYIYIYIKFLFF